MRTLLFKNLRQIHLGEIISGIGFLAYLVGAALEWPGVLMTAGAAIFMVIAIWTLVSMLVYPKEKRIKEFSYNLIIGQGALTVLLGACLYLTVRGG